jgi:hypothetical protein
LTGGDDPKAYLELVVKDSRLELIDPKIDDDDDDDDAAAAGAAGADGAASWEVAALAATASPPVAGDGPSAMVSM